MKKTIVKYLLWALTVLWMVLIFCFSADNAGTSSQKSSGFTREVLETFPSFKELPEEEKVQIVEKSQFAVRKCAHFSLYAGLGMLMYGSFMFIPVNKKRIFALLCCGLYAVSDEIHQLFSDGRACQIRDMCIDTCGALFGILFVTLILYVIKKIKIKKSLQ